MNTGRGRDASVHDERRPLRRLVVDSNCIVHGAWRLDSAPWSVVLYQCRSGSLRLVAPEVVIREVVGRFSEELRNKLGEAATTARKLRYLTGSTAELPDTPSSDQVVPLYESELRQMLRDAGAEIPPLPKIDIDDLVNRAIYRRKPFDQSGSGFRDALLWESIVGLFSDTNDLDVVLVSNDSTAFAESRKSSHLHPSLATELSDRGITGQVRLAADLVAYLDGEGVGDQELLAGLAKSAEERQDELVAFARSAVEGKVLEPGDVPGARARVVALSDPRVYVWKVSGITDSAPEIVLAHLVIAGSFRIELRDDARANAMSTQLEVELQVLATASLNTRYRTFSEFQVELPAITDVADVLSELRRSEPLQVHPVTFVIDTNVYEALRKAPPFDPSVLEAMRKATAIDPAVLEAMRKATAIDPAVFEAMRKATAIDPAVLEAMRQITQMLPRGSPPRDTDSEEVQRDTNGIEDDGRDDPTNSST